MPSLCCFAAVRSSPPVIGSDLAISPELWSTITSLYLLPSLTVYTESCGLPFSISNLAETGLPFFLLVFSPSSSVTLALATTGASSAFSLSLIAALAGITQQATARADRKTTGILGMVASLDICCSEFGPLSRGLNPGTRGDSGDTSDQKRYRGLSSHQPRTRRKAYSALARAFVLMSNPEALQHNRILSLRMLRPAQPPVNFEGFVRIRDGFG